MTRGPLLAWAALLVLLAVEVVLALLRWRGVGELVLFAAVIASAGIAVTAFMRLGDGPSLARVFAAAGLLWTAILLGMGVMDPLTRTDYPVAVTRFP